MTMRLTVRTRLTLLYTGVLLLCGAGLLAFTYFLVDRTNGDVEFINGTVKPSSQAASFHTYSTVVSGRQVAGLPIANSQISNLLNRTHANDLHRLLVESGVALAVMTVVAIALGYLVAGRTLRPLRSITAAAGNISAANLHERLAMAGPRDELKELGDTFDGLLGRLEASFNSQRQFVANASHELRSPLTRLRVVAEVAATDESATVESLRATYRRVIAASEHQERLIEALLTLAQSQAGTDIRDTFDLAAIAATALPTLRNEADNLDIEIGARLEPAPVMGDHRLVERLVANLIDNALRYNIVGGRLDLATGSDEDGTFLAVSNDGPEVLPTELGRLFEPFQRLQAGRRHHENGHGLGLSIVEAIADAHEARVTAEPRAQGGLRIEVRFPPVAQPTGARR